MKWHELLVVVCWGVASIGWGQEGSEWTTLPASSIQQTLLPEEDWSTYGLSEMEPAEIASLDLEAPPEQSLTWFGDLSLENRIYWLHNALQSPFILQNRPAQKLLFSSFSNYNFSSLNDASLTILADASYQYLLNGDDLRDEFLVFGLVKWDQPFSPGWKWTAQSTMTTFQLPFDITDLREDRAETAVVRGSSQFSKLGLDWQSDSPFQAQLLLQGDRNWYQDARENYGTLGARLEVGWRFSKNAQLSAWSTVSERLHDDRKVRSATGAIGTSILRYTIHQSQLRWKQVWLQQSRGWHLTTISAFDFQRQDDNGGRYYNYDRWVGSLSLAIRYADWRLNLDSRTRYYDYAVRKASDRNVNYRWEYELSADLEYEINERYAVTAGGTWFKSQGNDLYDVYEYFQYYLGVKIAFDLNPFPWSEMRQ